jgi:hypothetical protein
MNNFPGLKSLCLCALIFGLSVPSFAGDIVTATRTTPIEQYAALELQRYLYQITGEKLEIKVIGGKIRPGSFILGQKSTNPLIDKNITDKAGPQGYTLRRINENVFVAGADPEGVLYGVYGLLEDHYGVGFYLGGDVLPEKKLPLMPESLNETKTPAVAIRGFLPWTNFPQSATSYSWEDWKFIIDQAAKMRFNFIHIHNYNGEAGHNEMYHNFSVNGILSRVWMATAKTGHGWACPGWDVNQYRFGASDLFGDYDFGSDVALHNETLTNEQVFRKGVSLFQKVIAYAHTRGVKIGLGLDVDLILPEYKTTSDDPKVIEAQVKEITTNYPDLDYLLCFQSEGIAANRELWNKWRRVFDGFYAGMKAKSPGTLLAVAGWGINPVNTATLPADVICAPISAYSDGCETGSIYGDREYWGCPWLERDFNSSEYYYPYNMHLSNTIKAWNNRAPNMKGFYCLTWRLTDAIDPKMSFMSRAPWNDMTNVTSKDIYNRYAVQNYGEAAALAITEIINQNEPFASGFGECQETPAFKLLGADDYLMNIRTITIDGKVIDATKPAALNGTQNAPCIEGGECVGFIKKDNWLKYNGLDFGLKTENISIRVSSATHGGVIRFCLDSLKGPVIGEYTVNDTQGWQSWINVSVPVKPVSGTHNLVLYFLEKPKVSVMPEHQRALGQLAVIDGCIATATPAQKDRLQNLRCRIAATADHILLNEKFADTTWTEMPDVMQSWARNFTHRVTDISSLGNVMSSQNRFVQLNYLPREAKAGKPRPVNAPLHPVVISAPASTLAGQPAPLTVRVLDSKTFTGVSATLYWRRAGEAGWNSLPMNRRVKAIFTASLPAEGLVEYFLSVTDGNSSVRWPAAGTRSLVTIGDKPSPAPEKPGPLSLNNRTISWSAVPGAFRYNIYRGFTPDFLPGPANHLTYSPSSATSFIDGANGFDGKPLSGNLYYKVTALDKADNESAASGPLELAARMQWWRDARFGMFIHWDMSSVAGTEISWSRLGPKPLDGPWGSPAGTGGDPVYDNLYKQFNPVKYDAREWVRIAKDAGMKYVVFTTKHHGGFAMWDTKMGDYSIMNTPFKRDVVKELADACHEAGLKFGIYYSPRDWWHPDYGVGDNAKYEAYMTGHLTELLSNYGAVDVVWFDSFGTGSSIGYWHADKVLELVRRLQPQAVINNRCGFFMETIPLLQADFDTPEQTIGSYRTNRDWESCMCVVDAPGGGWSYRKDGKVKPLDECIRTLVSCATGDGNLLLDVGPDATGIIPADQAGALAGMGEWIRKYGESIYGTEGGPFRNGAWGGGTFKGNKVYVHLFDAAPDRLELPMLHQKLVSWKNLSGGKVAVELKNGKMIVITAPSDRISPDTIIELTFDQDITRVDE